MLTKVTSQNFQGLTNPYTGEPMVVFMHVSPSGVKFTCPDTFSTADPAETTGELYARWNRKNGVTGLRAGSPIACAYTGELLSQGTRFGKPCYTGGFDPHMFYSREEFLYYAWMRDGKSPYPKPVNDNTRAKAPTREGEVTERHRAHAEAEAPKLDEEKVHMVEASMSKFKGSIEGSHTVSMHTSSKRGKNGK